MTAETVLLGRLPVDDRPALKMAGQGERHENH